jgi:hypothetical protein
VASDVRQVPVDDGEVECWERVTDDQMRLTGAQLIHLLPGLYTEVEVRGWNVTVPVMEFIRKEPLSGELRPRITAALRAVVGAETAQPRHQHRVAGVQHHYRVRVGGGHRGDQLVLESWQFQVGPVDSLGQLVAGEHHRNRCLLSGGDRAVDQRVVRAGRALEQVPTMPRGRPPTATPAAPSPTGPPRRPRPSRSSARAAIPAQVRESSRLSLETARWFIRCRLEQTPQNRAVN